MDAQASPGADVKTTPNLSSALAMAAAAALLAAAGTARAGTLSVTSASLTGTNVQAGSTMAAAPTTGAGAYNVVHKLSLSATGTTTVKGLKLQQNGTALPSTAAAGTPNDTTKHQVGAEITGLQLWDDKNGNGVPDTGEYLGTAGWSPSQGRWVFEGLNLSFAGSRTLLVTLAAGTGANVGNSVALALASAADVTVNTGDSVASAAASAPAFTFVANPRLDGSPTASAPMLVLLNPGDGTTVQSPFRVQVQVFDPQGLAGLGAVQLSIDNGVSVQATSLTRNANYDGVVGDARYAAVYDLEAQATHGLTLNPGSYTLRARASHGVTVFSGAVVIQVVDPNVRAGDGNVLVRDNSSQLCSDCHALQTHSSQAMTPSGGTSQYGAWAAVCKDCHAPHRTTNVFLVKNRITPPSVQTYQQATNVAFSTTTGDTGTATVAVGLKSFTNGSNDGPCQVCHTRTSNPSNTTVARWRRTGNSDTHYTKAGAGGTQACINCHSHQNGFAASCSACHGDASRPGDAGIAPPKDTCGDTTFNQAQANVNRVGAHQAHAVGRQLSNGNAYGADANACVECHVYPPQGAHPAGASCSTANRAPISTAWGNAAIGSLAKLNGSTPTWNATNQTCSATYCHGNMKNGPGPSNVSPAWTTQFAVDATLCTKCHGTPPGGTHPSISGGTNCQSCHPGYNYVAGTVPVLPGAVDPVKHVNGVIDGGEGGGACSNCHSNITNAMSGGAGTTFPKKHTLSQFAQADVSTLPGWNSTGSLQTAVTAANRSCVNMCHGDHPHDQVSGGTHANNVYVDARTYAARANNAGGTTQTQSTATRMDRDFDSTRATGGLCMSCHQTQVDASHGPVTTAMFTPSAHNYTASAAGTTTTWQYNLDTGAFVRNCTKCHASPAEGQTPVVAAGSGSWVQGPHYGQNDSLLAGVTRGGAGTTAANNLVCWNCHGGPRTGHDYSSKDVSTVLLGKASRHPVESDTTHDTAAEATATWNSGKFSGTARHVNCLDCHDPHMAKATLFARSSTATSARNALTNAMAGAEGVRYSSYPALPTTACASGATLPNACVSQTTAANFSTTPVAATFEYEVCFKCHSSFAFGNTTWPNGLSGQQETDVAAEFSPNNKSGHPVVTGLNNYPNSTAPKSLVAAQLLPPWNTNVGTQTMLCSDCHNTDAASPAAQGPHGSAVTFMLAGANRAWPYTVAGANSGTLFKLSTAEQPGLGTANGLFCRNCHPQTNSAGSNSEHRNTNLTGGQHGGNATVPACVACHVRVPHGGKLSRLWVTTNAPARYKVGTPNFAQVTKAATKDTYSTSGFPAGFKSSCGQHSGGTGTEAW
jgi:predicted CxxxxCH...CXXCH cytochrome family protein